MLDTFNVWEQQASPQIRGEICDGEVAAEDRAVHLRGGQRAVGAPLKVSRAMGPRSDSRVGLESYPAYRRKGTVDGLGKWGILALASGCRMRNIPHN